MTASFHQVIAEGNLKACQMYVAGGVDLDASDETGWTPLVRAVWHGQLAVCQLLIESGADIEKGENSPLLFAATTGNAEICAYLIKAGANIEAVGYWQATPLLQAVLYSHEKACAVLIEAGASLDAKDASGKGIFDLTKRASMISLLQAAVIARDAAATPPLLRKKGAAL